MLTTYIGSLTLVKLLVACCSYSLKVASPTIFRNYVLKIKPVICRLKLFMECFPSEGMINELIPMRSRQQAPVDARAREKQTL